MDTLKITQLLTYMPYTGIPIHLFLIATAPDHLQLPGNGLESTDPT